MLETVLKKILSDKKFDIVSFITLNSYFFIL